MSLAVDGDDPFWSVQLTSNTPSRPFAQEGLADFEDRALPAGAAVTEHSLASVFGRVCEVSVPLVRRVEDDDRFGVGGNEDRSDVGSSTTTNKASFRQTSSSLVLKLRQVNGDGVMSGVGGDVWCAALLLSAWLLENPEAVRGLDVLELGSGLGLCGIVAGYLARSVTLTDYIDELIVNLHHNVEMNRVPRAIGVGEPPTETTEPPSESPQQQQEQQQKQQQKQLQSRGDQARRLALRPLSRSRVRVRKLDWTAYGDGAQRKDPNPLRGDDRGDEEWRNGAKDVEGWWWEDRGPNADRPGRPMDGGDRERPTATAPEDAEAKLRCDVVIGSALIYSPHHSCVADVLSRAFSEGGCREAHAIQLSTRPGFDDFLRRLGSCGLRYRLHRISAVLPAEILEKIRLLASATVVGGPVTSGDTNTYTHHAGNADGGNGGEGEFVGTVSLGESGAGDVGEVAAAAAAAAGGAGFEEFVLCSVFRATAEHESALTGRYC